MDFIKISHQKLSVEEVTEVVTAANCGAISLFIGTTRDNFEGKTVINLEYEAYEPMAEKAIKQICNDLRQKWKTIENIAIYHRLGRVAIKESSVIIGISSPHRQDSLEATQWCIDTLKKSVPIWKKEVYDDSKAQWKENSECAWSTNKANKLEFKSKVECSNVPSHLIQINCTNEELDRRIDNFMKMKREQMNNSNISEFCGNVDEGCARVNTIGLRRPKNTKSHLRTQRVYNHYAPYNVSKEKEKPKPYISSVIEDRVATIEKSLDVVMKPVSTDIYERLKILEDRMLFLESLSPEYAHLMNKGISNSNNKLEVTNQGPVKKQAYSLEDINNLLFELEKKKHIKSAVSYE